MEGGHDDGGGPEFEGFLVSTRIAFLLGMPDITPEALNALNRESIGL